LRTNPNQWRELRGFGLAPGEPLPFERLDDFVTNRNSVQGGHAARAAAALDPYSQNMETAGETGSYLTTA
jgi:hypothetical protein